MPVVEGQEIFQIVYDLATSLSTAGVVIFLVMSLAYRSLRIGLISIIPNVLPLAVTAMVLLLFGYPLSLTSVCAFVVCVGIAVDDTIHFLTRFLERVRVGPLNVRRAEDHVSCGGSRIDHDDAGAVNGIRVGTAERTANASSILDDGVLYNRRGAGRRPGDLASDVGLAIPAAENRLTASRRSWLPARQTITPRVSISQLRRRAHYTLRHQAPSRLLNTNATRTHLALARVYGGCWPVNG